MPVPPAIRNLARRFVASLCGTGLWLGTLFFAGSLTPSLVPRDALLQGALSGLVFAVGYGLGALLRALWRFLGLPNFDEGTRGRWMKGMAAASCIGIAVLFLWEASEWQNSVRLPMGLEPVESARPALVGAVAAAVALACLALARLFRAVSRLAADLIDRIAPRRFSVLAGIVVTALLFWGLGSGVILEAGIRALDSSYARLDDLVDDTLSRPSDPMKTGSTASLLQWDDLGRMGRRAVAAGPTAADIERFTGEPAMEPLRVYVGLNSADTIEERIDLAFQEMLRVGAFERSVLVVTMPTGTGWMDQAGQMPLEYLHRGDVATVAVQYSYLASWLALMVEPTYGADTARQLFHRVYDHWRTLPRDTRPRLYLHGISLGALNSDLSVDLFDVIGDPFQGALWSGPPFPSRTWSQATAERRPGTPAWAPRFRDGSVIRFTGAENMLDQADAPWGPLRIVFLQYASDPITFFEPGSAWRAPDWMNEPRGPDVSPELRWYPIITFFQLGLDMALATTTPMGHGHIYAPEHYIDAWVAVTEPGGWTPDRLEALKVHLRGLMPN
ncbi:alpha/beta-hydrolase family protein [Aureimonas sp. SK2]|uniref:alpha/beta hydrolase n=1 Tax=Aureimonas sp. SK2 TaxID=3015992 RepID=UPI002443BE70|nr:alpha/beta-hydrolase family protein [Aureimonas sp. SK2]